MTHHERPFLTAHWTDLLLLNFPVPTDAIAQLAPPGTEPDLFDGQAYISIVGFQFRDTRVLDCAWPRHTHFLEINLRYYVRRNVGDQIRRGVVFAQEIVPRRLIALVANRLFHEHYICRRMRSQLRSSDNILNQGDQVAYGWQSRGTAGKRWNSLAARVAGPLALPPANSMDEFIVEHYWGYTQGRDGITREYHVGHDPWRVAAADNVTWDCDIAANYNAPLAQYLASPPATAIVAEGAAVEVFPGLKL